MKKLVATDSLCTGCGKCTEACSKAYYKVQDKNLACLRVSENPDGTFHVEVCDQCGECAAVCNTNVIRQDKFGVFRLNKKECAGCLMCVGYCPKDVMVQSDDHLEPSKCVACGLCVKACPTGALSITDK